MSSLASGFRNSMQLLGNLIGESHHTKRPWTREPKLLKSIAEFRRQILLELFGIADFVVPDRQ